MRAEATSFLSPATVLAAAVGFAAPQPVALAASRVLHSNQGATIAHSNQDNVIPGLLGIHDEAAAQHDWIAWIGGTGGMGGILVADWYVQSPAVPVEATAAGAHPGTPLVRLNERLERASASPRTAGTAVPAPGALPLFWLLLALGPGRQHRRETARRGPIEMGSAGTQSG